MDTSGSSIPGFPLTTITGTVMWSTVPRRYTRMPNWMTVPLRFTKFVTTTRLPSFAMALTISTLKSTRQFMLWMKPSLDLPRKAPLFSQRLLKGLIMELLSLLTMVTCSIPSPIQIASTASMGRLLFPQPSKLLITMAAFFMSSRILPTQTLTVRDFMAVQPVTIPSLWLVTPFMEALSLLTMMDKAVLTHRAPSRTLKMTSTRVSGLEALLTTRKTPTS
mmetsp:Transcript_12124/g.27213  ORF Transcript_12124/g.27213 Transcript_12124/m.27213 type:complete len:220 (-) Transcript_12124:298-957(-)